MKWPGSGGPGRQFPASRVRSGDHFDSLLFPWLLGLLLTGLVIAASVRAATDEYTLPDNHPCFVTLEAYKKFFGPLIDDYYLRTAYQNVAANMNKWQRCCPGGDKTVAKFRPKNADAPLPNGVLNIELPPVFSIKGPCNEAIYGDEGWLWLEEQVSLRENYWQSHYNKVTNSLYECCVEHLNTCLGKAFAQGGDEAGRERMSAESTRCLERFSPDYVAKAAAESSPGSVAAEPKQSAPRQEPAEEATRIRQAAARCESDLARIRMEQEQCVQQAQLTTQTNKTEITRLSAQVAEERNESARRIQDVLVKIAPRPGVEVLGGFPSGAGSAGLVSLEIVVLTAGFFLGWPGRSRGARRVSGVVSVMVALFVYLVSVALLPDTQFGELLLAATAAVLVVAFRALVRSQWELRMRGQTPPPPPSP